MIVQGVPERLGRVANNLLDNAARHSPPGGVVKVTVDREGLRVRDHGTGIDETDLPYVFDRFYRGANSRGRQGTGLGLAIVRQVADPARRRCRRRQRSRRRRIVHDQAPGGGIAGRAVRSAQGAGGRARRFCLALVNALRNGQNSPA